MSFTVTFFSTLNCESLFPSKNVKFNSVDSLYGLLQPFLFSGWHTMDMGSPVYRCSFWLALWMGDSDTI